MEEMRKVSEAFSRMVGLGRGWKVSRVEFSESDKAYHVHVARTSRAALRCPECGARSPGYDTVLRKWRHLDACEHQLYLVCEVPRVNCAEHGKRMIELPWAEKGSRYTALFEAYVIRLLKEASVSAVSRQVGLGWKAVAGLMKRATERGLARRRAEHRELTTLGDETLKGSRYQWLTRPEHMNRAQRRAFNALMRRTTLRTARAWALKEEAAQLWDYLSRAWALKAWKRWLAWASRCRLAPVLKAARMIREHLWGIINAIVLKASNGPAEGINSRIRLVKIRSHGFRSEERFCDAIYFHLGGLNLYPAGVPSAD